MGGCCGKGGAKKHRKSSYDELSTNEVQNALLELMNTERSYGAVGQELHNETEIIDFFTDLHSMLLFSYVKC